jgi:hypothetical protein
MRLQRSPRARRREKRFCAASDIDHAAVGILASIMQSLEIRGLISREHSSRYALSRAVLRAKLPDDRWRLRARQVNAPRSSRPSKADLESPDRRATDDRSQDAPGGWVWCHHVNRSPQRPRRGPTVHKSRPCPDRQSGQYNTASAAMPASTMKPATHCINASSGSGRSRSFPGRRRTMRPGNSKFRARRRHRLLAAPRNHNYAGLARVPLGPPGRRETRGPPAVTTSITTRARR